MNKGRLGEIICNEKQMQIFDEVMRKEPLSLTLDEGDTLLIR